jgi:transcriptional regulator with XRE-family HTH domain
MSYAGKNLKFIRKQRDWTQEELANQLQIKRSLVGAYEEGRAEPRLEVQEAICALFNISLEIFLFQDLSQMDEFDLNQGYNMGGSYLERRRSLKTDTSNSAAIVSFVPVKAAAGYLAGYADPEFIDELNTFTLPMLAPGEYRAFEIVGDSMLPTQSGSVIVGERVSSLKDVKSSNTYIVISKLPKTYEKRQDLLAFDMYNRADYDWVILQYNNIVDIEEEFITGVSLILPSKLKVDIDIMSNTSRNINVES